MAAQSDPDGESVDATAAAAAKRTARDKLLKRKAEQKATSDALREQQLRKTDNLLLHMSMLGEFLDECSVTGPGTIDWVRPTPRSGEDEAEVAIVGQGASGRVVQATIFTPGHRRVHVLHIVLKECMLQNWDLIAHEIDHEVTRLLTLHETFNRGLTLRSLQLCPAAVPLQLPIPNVIGLYAVTDPAYPDDTDMMRVKGFFMDKYECSLATMLQEGPVLQDEFYRVLQAMATALALVHRAGLKKEERRDAGGRHLGGLHCDVKPQNTLLQLDKRGRLHLPVHTVRAADATKVTTPVTVLADYGLAVGATDQPHHHGTSIVTIRFRTPALALSDLARIGEDISDLVPHGAPPPPVCNDLILGTDVDMHSLGVVCWDMLRAPVYHADKAAWLRLIARGIEHASGDRARLPTDDERPGFAFAELLTGGLGMEADELLALLHETFAESVLLRWSRREAGGVGTEAEGAEGGAWWPELMPKAFLYKLARASRRLVPHVCESDRVIADAAYRMPGEDLVHSAVGILNNGAAVPARELTFPLELPTDVAEKIERACEALRQTEAHTVPEFHAVPEVHAMREVHTVPEVYTLAERRESACSLATSTSSPPWSLNSSVAEDTDSNASDSTDGTSAGSVSDSGGDVGQLEQQGSTCELDYAAQGVLYVPATQNLTSLADAVQGCSGAERLAADAQMLLSNGSGAEVLVVPDRSALGAAKAVLASTAAADEGTVADEVILLGARCQGSSGVLPMGAATFGTADGTAKELGAEGRASWVSLSDDGKASVYVAGATDSESSSVDASECSSRLSIGSLVEAKADSEAQEGAKVETDVESAGEKAEDEAESDFPADAETEEPPERVTFKGYISVDECPKEAEPEAEAAEWASGGSCMWRSSTADDSGRLIGSCPGEAPSCGGETVDIVACPSHLACCLSEAKMSLAEELGKDEDAEEELLDVLAEEAAPGKNGLLLQMKRALGLSADARAQRGHREAHVEAQEIGAKGVRAKKSRVACLLGRIIGCRGLRVQE